MAFWAVLTSLTGRSDEKLSPDLLRCRGKLIGGDLDADDEGSKHNTRTLAITTP
jgi:hypothetical protein